MPIQFVPAVREHKSQPTPKAEINMVIDAPLAGSQHVEVKTSSVDRAKGFLISSVPLYAAFGVVVACVGVVGYGIPLLTLPTLTIFWLAFVAAWLLGYGYNLKTSAEGVSLYEATQKWKLIFDEHNRRWDAWHDEQRRLRGESND